MGNKRDHERCTISTVSAFLEESKRELSELSFSHLN